MSSESSPLASLPSVDAVLRHRLVGPLVEAHGRQVVLEWIRWELDELRDRIRAGCDQRDRQAWLEELAERVQRRAAGQDRLRLGRVINATGVILHTGLGRAPLSQAARSAVMEQAGAANVEIDLETGQRRYRGYQLLSAWQTLTGCEDALVVNNNAAATLLTLQGLCAGREVLISRGQLIEIGGSFRLPEIFATSGAVMREVGTTNRTRLSDYENAINEQTAAILHVHPSNYRIVGFTASPSLAELVELAHGHGLLAIDDIGSGALVDVTAFGLPAEPTFPQSLRDGADLVLGSGDKLLGGPQAGIILGRRDLIERLRRHPLARTLRVDKLTLAALAATLDAYLRDEAAREIPVLQMLATPLSSLFQRAEAIHENLGAITGLTVRIAQDRAPVGGGSVPAAELPTVVLELEHASLSAEELARRLRVGSIRIVPRVQHQRVFIDLRSVLPEDDSRIALALRLLAEGRE